MNNKEISKFIYCNLSCPKCQNIFHNKNLTCSNCGHIIKKDEDAVLRLYNKKYTFSKDQKSMMKLINEIRNIKKEDFYQNFEEYENDFFDFSYDYCVNPRRTDWTLLGDFHNKIILELGAGYGNASISLSKYAKHIFAVDATLERIKFCSLRAKMEEIDNLTALHADVTDLPFKNKSFDTIIMIGLLEYGINFYDKKSDINNQIIFLESLKDLLVEDGEIWIAVENKYSFIHFLGSVYHQEIPYTPLFNMEINKFIYKLLKRNMEAFLHSKKGYKKILNDAGFYNIKFFYSFPNYKMPKYISSDEDIILDIIKNHLKSKNKLLVPLIDLFYKNKIAKILIPSFFIRARK